MPRTTSTLAISSVAMLRMSTPAFVKSREVACESQAPARYCILALVEMGAPSTTKLVPSDDVA